MTESEVHRILERLKAGEYHIGSGSRTYTGDFDVSVLSFSRARGVFLSETYACHPNGEELVRSEEIPEAQIRQRFLQSEAQKEESCMSKTLEFTYRL